MANLLVFVEVRRGEATGPSVYAVGEARRVARELGATVYAVLPIGPAGESAIDGYAHRLGEAGADRILCCADPALEGALLDGVAGPLLAALVERLRPVLTIFPAGAVGPALGPPLAVALFERLAFNSTQVIRFLGERLLGGFGEAFSVRGQGRKEIESFSDIDPISTFSNPHIWGGLAVAGLLLAVTVRLRRSRDAI